MANGIPSEYKELFGSLFNSATVAFYWKKFEMEPNRLRFREEYWDTEEYWNQAKEPKTEPHWRRPAPDPIIDFLESKGIKILGHPIIWGNSRWHHPEWLFEQFCPDEEKERLNEFSQSELWELTPAQIEELAPIYTQEIKRLFEKRVVDLANYYGDRIHSWDVVNECVKRLLYKWLNRRGGKPAWKWNKISRLISEWLPLAKPRVYHSYLLAKP